jgi:hypothetical protein
MNGFFDRMAQRAIGTETHWQVRPRARFEPAAASGTGWDEVDDFPVDSASGGAVAGSSTVASSHGPDVSRVQSGTARERGRHDVVPLGAASPSRAGRAQGLDGVETSGPERDLDGRRTARTGPSRTGRADPVQRPSRQEDGARRAESGAIPVNVDRPATPGMRPAASQHADVDQDSSGSAPAEHGRSGRRQEAVPAFARSRVLAAADDWPVDPRNLRTTGTSASGDAARRPDPVPDTATLLGEHVVPALRARGLIVPGERVDLAAGERAADGSARLSRAPRPGAVAVRTGSVHRDGDRGDAVPGDRSTEVGSRSTEVHVHIDRVEVLRAAAAPAPPPLPAIGPAAPSRLDTYLEQRRTAR